MASIRGVMLAFLCLLGAGCEEATEPAVVEPNPLPSLFTLAPATAQAGAAAFTLTVRGADFVAASRVRWDGADLSTTFVSDSVLTAAVPAARVAAPDIATVTVFTGPPGGGTSGGGTFTVEPPPPLTWISTPVAVGASTWDVTISSNGIAYATRLSQDSITRINVAGNSVLGSFPVGNWPYEVMFNAAGSVAYVTHAVDNTIRVVNTATHAVTATWQMPAQPIRVLLNNAGTKLYVTYTDGFVDILNPSTGATVSPSVFVGGVLNGIALTPDGTRLWVSNTTGLVAEINTSTDAAARSIVMGGRPQQLAIAADGARMYVANEAGWIGVYRLSDLARVDSIAVTGPFGLAFSPDNSLLWVTQPNAGTVSVVYTAYGSSAGVVVTGGRPFNVAVAPDGTALIAVEGADLRIVRQSP